MTMDEVSTGSVSDRVIISPNSTIMWIEDPVATAPGTDPVNLIAPWALIKPTGSSPALIFW